MSSPEHEPTAEEASTERGHNWGRIIACVSLLVVAIVVGVNFGNSIFHAIIDAKDFLRAQPVSLLGYFAVFSLMSMFFMPYSPFCIAIGFIFGISVGLAIEMLNILVSSSLIFVLSRYLIKKRVEDMIQRSEGSTAHTLWTGLIAYMGRDWREAAKINLLLCFIPMPYGMNRYLFSLTNVPFLQYNFFFMIGMVPNTVLNLLIGAALAEASEQDGVDSLRLTGTLLALIGILAAIWYAKSVAQKLLADAKAKDTGADLEDSGGSSASEVVLSVCSNRAPDAPMLPHEQGGHDEGADACVAAAGSGSLVPDAYQDGSNHETSVDAGGNGDRQEEETPAKQVEVQEVEVQEDESDQRSLLR
jgi:uncharacterized membrane protein YdjX (TVP38/TMEM64 family)